MTRAAEQIFAYCVCALASGVMFFLWRRLDVEDRRRMWRYYGVYSGLMLCGSCFGTVSWSAQMMNFAYQFQGNQALSTGDRAQYFSFFSNAIRWRSAFVVMYPCEFMCLSAAKLLVLDRMAEFAVHRGDSIRKRMVLGGRIVMAVVVLGNALGLFTNIASVVHYLKASEHAGMASVYYSANNSAFNPDGLKYRALFREEFELALKVVSVQSFCEAAVLLLIVAAFVVVGFLCARRLRQMLSTVDSGSVAASTGRTLQRQMLATTGFVFAAFLLRSAYSTMFALAWGLQDVGNVCGTSDDVCDPTCFNVYRLMNRWMFYTPEFQLTVMLISSPLALLVALWGMTAKATLRVMQAKWREIMTAPTQLSLVSQ